MSLSYPGVPGYPYYPYLSPWAPGRQWPVPVIVIVIVVITIVGWTPPEILRLLTLLHAAG